MYNTNLCSYLRFGARSNVFTKSNSIFLFFFYLMKLSIFYKKKFRNIRYYRFHKITDDRCYGWLGVSYYSPFFVPSIPYRRVFYYLVTIAILYLLSKYSRAVVTTFISFFIVFKSSCRASKLEYSASNQPLGDTRLNNSPSSQCIWIFE